MSAPTKSEKIQEALKQLDPKNDNHWTAEGAPRLETLRLLAADTSISRDDVNSVDQSLTRDSVIKAAEKAAAELEAAKKQTGETPINAEGESTEGKTQTTDTPPVVPIDAEGTPVAHKQSEPVDPDMHVTAFDADGHMTTGVQKDLDDKIASYTTVELQAELDKISANVAEMDKDIAQIQKAKAHLLNISDIIASRMAEYRQPEHMKQQQDIHAYLATQQRKREEISGSLAEQNIRKLPQAYRSPLDQYLGFKGRKRA